VEEAKDTVERQTISKGLADRGEQAQYVAYAVTTLDAEDKTPARTNDVYERYQQLVGRTGERVLSTRWVREHLDSLAMLGIISADEINEGAGGGQYKEYELDQAIDVIVEALDETIDYVGIHESIQKHH
jgi:cell division control protein 6